MNEKQWREWLESAVYGEPVNCGCGGTRKSDTEVERVIREIEEEREKEPVVIPVRPERIPAPEWPKREKVPVER